MKIKGHLIVEKDIDIRNGFVRRNGENFYFSVAGTIPGYVGVVDVENQGILKFDSDNFYFTEDSETNPIISLRSNFIPITDHGALSGLLNNDHPQYLLRIETPPGFYGVIFKDGVHTFRDDTIRFNQNEFYLTDENGKPQLNLIQQPTDTSLFALRSELSPGFYGIVFEESDLTNSQKADTLRFLVTDFDLSNVGNKPQVALASNVARISDVGPGFYGILVGETDGTPIYRNIVGIKFNSTNFYIEQNAPNTDEVIVNFRGDPTVVQAGSNITVTRIGDTFTVNANVGISDIGPGFYGIIFKDGIHTLRNDTLRFNSNEFYLTNEGSKPQLNLILQPTDTSLFALKSDLPPAFYGITIGQANDLPTFKAINVIKFHQTDFYVQQNTPNTDEVIVNFRPDDPANIGSGNGIFAQRSGKSLQFKSLIAGTNITLTPTTTDITISATAGTGQSDPGFYGITVAETDGIPSFRGLNKLNFNATDFYLEQNTPNTDEVSINFRPDSASNLGSGSGILANKSGKDFQFKTLIAGTNITLTPTATDITITAAASASNPVEGFYGISVSDQILSYKNLNVVKFLNSDFYISQNSPNVDEVLVAAKPNTVTNVGSGNSIISDIVGKEFRFKSLTAGANVTLTPSATDIIISATAGTGQSDPGFYGIVVAETDGTPAYRGINKLNFHATDFYIEQNAPNTDEVVVNLRARGLVIRETDGTPIYGAVGRLSFNSDTFYLNRLASGEVVVNNRQSTYIFSGGVSTGGNTSGTTGLISNQLILAGGNNITLSQSILNGIATVTISAGAGAGGGGATLSHYPAFPVGLATSSANSGTTGNTGGSTQFTGSFHVCPMQLGEALSFSRINLHGVYTATPVAGTGSASILHQLGIYTLNVSTLSLLSSYMFRHELSQSSATAQTHRWYWDTNSTSNSSLTQGNVSTLITGTRNIVLYAGTSGSLSSGQYFLAHNLLVMTSSSNVMPAASMMFVSQSQSHLATELGSTNLLPPFPLLGQFSTTTNLSVLTSNFMPGSIHTSAITRTGGTSQWKWPHLVFWATS